MEKRYRVTLTESERNDLRKMVSVGKAAAQKLVRDRQLETLFVGCRQHGMGWWGAPCLSALARDSTRLEQYASGHN